MFLLQFRSKVASFLKPIVRTSICHIDPRGRPTVTAGSDNCFCTCRPFVGPSPLFKAKQISSENNVRYWRDCEYGRVDH